MEKIDFFSVTKRWVYRNYDRLIPIIHGRVVAEINLSEYDPQDQESVYNYIAARNFAKMVGEIFGLEIGFDDSNEESYMVVCDPLSDEFMFMFSHKFSWMNLEEYPNEKVAQDKRVLKLVRKKRKEFIDQHLLRERVESWVNYAPNGLEFFDGCQNADDVDFIQLYFNEMSDTMKFLMGKVYSRGLTPRFQLS